MTGTLFVNSSEDLETIISIGYKKAPMLNFDKDEYFTIQSSFDQKSFHLYYDGLISFYRIPSDAVQFPKKIFHLVPIEYEVEKYGRNEDPYYINSRTDSAENKIDWVINFIKNHRNEKTLIYTQFITRSANVLMRQLDKLNIPYGVINGAYNMVKKLQTVHKYNTNEIKVLIFTLSIKEGISFMETNNFIAIDPYWNYAIFEQMIARGIRLNSHKQGNKTNINLYFLVGVEMEDDTKVKKWLKSAQNIFNNDIKEFLYPIVKNDKGYDVKDDDIHKDKLSSRDIDMYNRMFRKQEEINRFERKLKKCKSFEESNDVENNEFIELYNLEILLQEKMDKILTNREKIKMKREMYNDFYKNSIEKIKDRFTRINNDSKYRTNRNPNLDETMTNLNFKDAEDKIRKFLKMDKTLDEIFESFKIDKTQITTFQANFTPTNHINDLIDLSGIKDDKREKIYILEPTAGIGGVISQLIKLNQHQNFLVDCNEIHSLFYQIGKITFEDISNVKWYNFDFFKYTQKYNYDYIIGNPPFNLKGQKSEVQKKYKDRPMTIKDVDVTYYDIDFVSKAYDILNPGGILCFIVSDRFLRQDNGRFKIFKETLEQMSKFDKSIVEIHEVKSSFRQDKNITKKMETSFGMVMIKLVKIINFQIILEIKEKRKKDEEKDEDNSDEDEYDKMERPKPKPRQRKKPQPNLEIPEELKPNKQKIDPRYIIL
jgi:hypothetical protein